MKRTLPFILLAAFYASFAQIPSSLLVPTSKISSYDDYEGSIYMKFRYKESSVIDEKSSAFDAKLKYNIYTDALEFVSKSGDLFELVKNPTIHARIDGDYFYYCDFKSQRGIDRRGYYVLVELTDRYRIYKRFTLEIKDPKEQAAVSSGVAEPGSIRMNTSYFIEEAGVIMELPLNKKEMLAAFSDKENELKEYLKKEKIRLKKEEDLIRFVARYNALKSDEVSQNRSLLSNANSDRN